MSGKEVASVTPVEDPVTEPDASAARPGADAQAAPPLTRHLGYLLRRAFVLSTDCANACIDEETSLREVGLLALLAEREPLSQREVGDLLHINRSIMVKLVDSMEARGLVARERNPLDRRSYALRLTGNGHRVRAQLHRDLTQGDDQLTDRLTAEEREWLNRTLIALLEDAKLAPIASLSQHCGYLIAATHRLFRARALERLAPIGLDPRDFGVLSVLDNHQPCSQNQLAGHLGISPPAALGCAEDLETRGLVHRERNESDRRAYDITVTGEGERRLAAARIAAADLERELSGQLGSSHERLHSVLLKLIS